MRAKEQNKRAEIEEGGVIPDERWLEAPRVYQTKKRHLDPLLAPSASKGLILDAGCGPGTYGIILAESGNKVVGVDISYQAVAVAKERAQRRRVGFVPLVADLESLPFKDDRFDACFSGWVLHHLPDIHLALSELTRVLKVGSPILLVEPNESSPALKLSRLVEGLARPWILKAGWDTPNRSTHLYNHYITALEELGFTNIRAGSCFGGGLPPLPAIRGRQRLGVMLSQLVLRLAFHLRTCFLLISTKILRPPLNGPELMITAVRGHSAKLNQR